MTESEVHYRTAIALDPTIANAYHQLGHILYNVKEEDAEAEACYRRALAIEPDCFPTLYSLANLLECKEDLPAAEHFYRRALKVNPTDHDTYLYLANVGLLVPRHTLSV